MLQSARGTRDILPASQPWWEHFISAAKRRAVQLNFQPITIPSFEAVTLFERSIGSTTDILEKELFLVGNPNASEAYALRPEGTAGIVRSFIEHGMHTEPLPIKLYAFLNNFRYERPQKGRYREFFQFDLEILGDKSPQADAQVILWGWLLFQDLGLNDITLQINSLGLLPERQAFIAALVEYLTPLQDQLSPDSKRRLTHNPLRVLDSKEASDQTLLQDAPSLNQFFGPESQAHFQAVLALLDQWGVRYELNNRLVRGLDYYCHTTFEWYLPDAHGQQSALGGGGRYDALLPQLGGAPVGGVGQALGVDRVIEALQERQPELLPSIPGPDLFLVAADPAGFAQIGQILPQLLALPITLDWTPSRSGLGNQLKHAAKVKAKAALIVGEQEVQSQIYSLKWLESGQQESVTLSNLGQKFNQ